jgi:menaquinone-dependent protoporphyrinogen oxidase
MRVLVATASKHGATAQIGAAIAEALRDQGLDVTELPAAEAGQLTDYDALVIGSGVYAGRWLGEAKTLISANSPTLRGRMVWLFSSGPLGDPPKPESDPVDVAELLESSGAIGHRIFAGRLDRSSLGFGEKAIVSLVRAPDGDFRAWDEVRDWAREIAVALSARV